MQNQELKICGNICFWNVAAETDRSKLERELTEIGQESCVPHKRTAFAAAKQACVKAFRGDGYRVEKLKDGNGLTIERITRGEIENEYTQIGYVLVDDETSTIEKCRIIDASIENPNAVENSLIEAFQVELGLCAANAVGLALARAVEAHDGYRLRPTGGVYFLPNFRQESFKKIAEIFEGCGVGGVTMVHRMEIAHGDQTIRAVHSTIRESIAERVAEMRQELTDGIKKAGRRNRTKECEDLIAQTVRYESLLDESLNEVRAELENVKIQLAMESVAGAASLFGPGVELAGSI